jgi:hypothetical protein
VSIYASYNQLDTLINLIKTHLSDLSKNRIPYSDSKLRWVNDDLKEHDEKLEKL